MRRLVLALLLMLPAPTLAAGDPYQTVIDWEDGTFLVSTRVGIDEVDFWRFPFALDECHRTLLLDLLYDPQELLVDAPGVGEAALLYEFDAEVWTGDGATRVAAARVSASGFGHALGTTPAAGAYELRLTLRTGADVDWSARLRARETFGEVACLPRLAVNEVESDPPGADVGNEWVELYNPTRDTVDAGGWSIVWAGGSATLPEATSVAPRGHLKVALPDADLPATAVVSVVALLGYTADTTPALDDAQDDARTWQRAPDGSAAWSFAAATPGVSNA